MYRPYTNIRVICHRSHELKWKTSNFAVFWLFDQQCTHSKVISRKWQNLWFTVHQFSSFDLNWSGRTTQTERYSWGDIRGVTLHRCTTSGFCSPEVWMGQDTKWFLTTHDPENMLNSMCNQRLKILEEKKIFRASDEDTNLHILLNTWLDKLGS